MNEPFVLLVGAGIALVLFVAYLGWVTARRRREEFFRFAAANGLEYSAKDPFNTDELPFALFRKGDGRDVENMMWGTAAGMKVRLFDFSYYETSTDAQGHSSRSTYRFSCAMADIDADCPHLVLGREGVLSRLADAIGFRDIEFESEEFNRSWQVTSEDRRFASAFIDPRMMEWLMVEGGSGAYEVIGPLLLCSTDRLKPAEYADLMALLSRFRAHVPAVVSSLYPRQTTEAGA